MADEEDPISVDERIATIISQLNHILEKFSQRRNQYIDALELFINELGIPSDRNWRAQELDRRIDGLIVVTAETQVMMDNLEAAFSIKSKNRLVQLGELIQEFHDLDPNLSMDLETGGDDLEKAKTGRSSEQEDSTSTNFKEKKSDSKNSFIEELEETRPEMDAGEARVVDSEPIKDGTETEDSAIAEGFEEGDIYDVICSITSEVDKIFDEIVRKQIKVVDRIFQLFNSDTEELPFDSGDGNINISKMTQFRQEVDHMVEDVKDLAVRCENEMKKLEDALVVKNKNKLRKSSSNRGESYSVSDIVNPNESTVDLEKLERAELSPYESSMLSDIRATRKGLLEDMSECYDNFLRYVFLVEQNMSVGSSGTETEESLTRLRNPDDPNLEFSPQAVVGVFDPSKDGNEECLGEETNQNVEMRGEEIKDSSEGERVSTANKFT